METKTKNYVLALDIGTTNLKCNLYSSEFGMNLIGCDQKKINIIHSTDGKAEICPRTLWNSIVSLVKRTIRDAGVRADQIACMGIACQRATFVTWDSETESLFHNLITWKDSRASCEISKCNQCISFRLIKLVCYFLYLLTGSPRFLIGSRLLLNNSHVTLKLVWMLRNNRRLWEAIDRGTAMFGTLDTWLLYRLTNAKMHCSDVSCASSTGFYDPFISRWSFLTSYFNIPVSMLPRVCDSFGQHFGHVSADIWGAEIPIMCCIADQSASMIGSRCLNRGDMKLTLGTGAFFDVHAGNVPAGCRTTLYPLFGWKYGNDRVHLLEGALNDCGTVVEWAHKAGFFESYEDLPEMLKFINDTDGVYFIPAFSDSQIQIEDAKSACGFVGIKLTTRKEHLLRAILESIVFGIYDLYSTYASEFGPGFSIRINGGVSRNDFICQSIADICRCVIKRPTSVEATAEGVALMAGHVANLWIMDDIEDRIDRVFHPNEISGDTLRPRFTDWKRYRSRVSNWHNSS